MAGGHVGGFKSPIRRAKNLHDGQWVYGTLTTRGQYEDKYFILHDKDNDIIYDNIDQDTIGLRSTAIDKHGNFVYAGDVVHIRYGDVDSIFKARHENLDYLFITEDDIWYRPLLIYPSSSIEVLGNIHENPELFQPLKNTDINLKEIFEKGDFNVS